MPSCPTMELAAIEESIDRQTDAVASATSSLRYGEMLRLQMLREMKDILEQAYRYRLESAELYRSLQDRVAEETSLCEPDRRPP